MGVVDEKRPRHHQQADVPRSAGSGKRNHLYINSPGGVVTSSMVIYDTMQMISSQVSTVCMGMAASMGSILPSGGKRGKRFIFPAGR